MIAFISLPRQVTSDFEGASLQSFQIKLIMETLRCGEEEEGIERTVHFSIIIKSGTSSLYSYNIDEVRSDLNLEAGGAGFTCALCFLFYYFDNCEYKYNHQ
jgi:hypothetical protein